MFYYSFLKGKRDEGLGEWRKKMKGGRRMEATAAEGKNESAIV